MITPLNKNVLIEPTVEKSAWSSGEIVYAEQGTILAISAEIENAPFVVGDIVHFDGHTASFRKDENDKDICLVSFDRIRAKN